jgi:hypothetical protein
VCSREERPKEKDYEGRRVRMGAESAMDILARRSGRERKRDAKKKRLREIKEKNWKQWTDRKIGGEGAGEKGSGAACLMGS